MRFEVHLSGSSGKATRIVELERGANGWTIALDGAVIDASAAEVAPNTLSILMGGRAYEVRAAPSLAGSLGLHIGAHEFTAEVADLRAWRGRRHGPAEAEGRQQVVAPMPGKVVRVLLQAGDRVEAGQGLMVVEAMKMQNEIRSPKSGTVERLLVKEGQPVNSGEVLAWID